MLLERYLPRAQFSSYQDFHDNYRVNVPENFNFAYDIIDEWARLCPDKPALHWVGNGDRERVFSFSEIAAMSKRAANLFHRCGVRKGDAVILICKQRPETWACFVALHRIGAICIPATFQLMEKDIVYRCNAASVKMLVCVDDPELVGHILDARARCETLETVAVLGERVPDGCLDFRAELARCPETWERPTGDQATRNEDIMLMYFSSGTTGMPKMVAHDFLYPLGHITTAKYWNQVEDSGLHMTIADSGWAKFGWSKIYGQWICGAVIVAYDVDGKFDGAHLLRTINRLRLTTFCAPPTVYRFLIKEDLSVCDWSSLRHCSIAGEPLNPEVYDRFLEATGLAVHEGFGQTETSVIIANFGFDPIKPGSTGKPAPLYDVDIVDADGNSCEDGVVGSIVVRNLSAHRPLGLVREYYRDPEANARAFHDDLYDTGDTGWRDSDGYIWFVGRKDDVIKCSGYRIGPFEVESALLTHPAVLECAVTAAPDPLRGQVVKATVVLVKNGKYEPSDQLRKELQNHVKKVTAPYKYPRILEFVEELPKTLSGKIKRGEIRKNDEK